MIKEDHESFGMIIETEDQIINKTKGELKKLVENEACENAFNYLQDIKQCKKTV